MVFEKDIIMGFGGRLVGFEHENGTGFRKTLDNDDLCM